MRYWRLRDALPTFASRNGWYLVYRDSSKGFQSHVKMGGQRWFALRRISDGKWEHEAEFDCFGPSEGFALLRNAKRYCELDAEEGGILS